MGTKVFFSDQNADIVSGEFESQGGVAVVTIRADTFGDSTIAIQMASKNDISQSNPSPGNPRFINLTNGELTDNGTLKLDYVPAGMLVRVVISSTVTPPTNAFADILQ